jgi:hypothetical protein
MPRFSLVVVVVAIAVTLQAASARPATAALGTAYSYGLVCAPYGNLNQVRVNWPVITSISGYPEKVYFLTTLYRWNPQTQTWYFWAKKPARRHEHDVNVVHGTGGWGSSSPPARHRLRCVPVLV